MTTVGSLCSGYDGLFAGIAPLLESPRLAWVSDIDPAACRVLAHRYPEVPNLGDLTAVDWSGLERVDVLCAGPPCQPTSSAGLRKGEADDRWLWPAVLNAVRHLRPRRLVFENPSALLGLHGGEPFGRILAALAEMGYVGAWGCLTAASVGACHRRERVVIVAADACGGEPQRRGVLRNVGGPEAGDQGAGGQRQRLRDAAGHRGATPAHADDLRREGAVAEPRGHAGGGHSGTPADPTDLRRERLGDPRRGRGGPANGGAPVADADGGRCEVGPQLDCDTPLDPTDRSPCGRHADGRVRPTDWGLYAPAIARHERVLGRAAPSPVDERGRLSPVFVEWMMMLPPGWVTDVPGVSRSAQLRLLGNGVVPRQATAAVGRMWS